jgi:hypothetical protein
MAENLEEKKMSADGQSSVESPVAPAGGEPKQSPTNADTKMKVHPEADTVADGVTKVTKNAEKAVEFAEEVELEETVGISGLFEGLNLSEEFKARAELVFEAAVNEAASVKAQAIVESVEADLKEQFETALNESLDEITENLDSYLDYVVQEWMKENEVAIESGIKVEMAESLMDGLKELFYEHNVSIDEATIDVVAELEEEVAAAKEAANRAINESIAVTEELRVLRAEKVFATMTEGLSQTQAERFRVLSEKLDRSDLSSYETDLATIKESFFKKKIEMSLNEDLDEAAGELVLEEAAPVKRSGDAEIDAYAAFLTNLK